MIHSSIKIKADIDSLISKLLEYGICDDSNFSAIHSLSEDIHEITFSGSNYISIGLRNYEYEEMYKEMLNNRLFNMKLIDGALVQLMYKMKGNHVKKHRLAFYPSPNLLPFQDNSDAYIQDELYVEIVKRKIIPFPLRFDFDIEANVDIKHPQSHLTLGDVKNCRIPISHPITPRWFIEFILRNFYQTEKNDFISQLPKHKLFFPSSITNNERNIIHMVVPDLNIK